MERKCMIQGVGKHIKYEGQIHMPHMPVNNIQTNWMGTIQKWSIRDEEANEIDQCIKDALYVPRTPMGLHVHSRFLNALSHHGVFTTSVIMHTNMEQTFTPNHTGMIGQMDAKTHNMPNTQQLLLKWHNCYYHLPFTELQHLAQKWSTSKPNCRLWPPHLPQQATREST